jgi:ATP/maltotriose-dependent transcriptional regulator MalT
VEQLLTDKLNIPPIRPEFVQRPGLIERLNDSLWDALTGKGNGQAIMEMLDRANLFSVPLDNEQRWYRFHHIFADLFIKYINILRFLFGMRLKKKPQYLPDSRSEETAVLYS